MVCGSCPFAGKSEVEVTIYRTDLAKAEADRLYAYKALDEARREVEAIGNGTLPQLGSPDTSS